MLLDRSVVRTWCMRGTLHLLAIEDVVGLLPLIGPAMIRRSRGRLAELGLDDETCAKRVRIIREVLADLGPLTRADLTEQLAAGGLALTGQAPYHLLRRAALEAVVCYGPLQQSEPTYVLLDEWSGVRPDGHGDERQLGELARRYLDAYGPAGPEDLATWSGLPIREARKAWKLIEDELVETQVVERPAWVPVRRAEGLAGLKQTTPLVSLLPSFDTYLLGYADRDLAVAPQYGKRVNRGGGLIRPTVLLDGRVAGTWNSKQTRGDVQTVVTPFEELSADVFAQLEIEATDLARFLEVDGELIVTEPSPD